ncbi:hypothetical protein [Hyphomonas sp.]|jgi:hypothetical protein|uniref:hypothetical protein n=1 Tax=Hyphomonas sp. TaxID=87 RepID=UPI0032D96759
MRTGLTAYAIITLASLGLAACVGAPDSVRATGDTSATTGDLELRASGAGNWDIDCVAVTGRGQANASVKGRGSTSTDMLYVRDVSSAACTYQTGASPVTLKLMEEGVACPFGAFEGGICQTILPAETSGTLRFSVR